MFLDSRLPSRFWSKVVPDPMGGCWLWIAALDDKGYGQFLVDRASRRAYRIAYETLISRLQPASSLTIAVVCGRA